MSEIHRMQEHGLEQDLLNQIMPTEFDAQILKLRLPEQDALKNHAECCSADPAVLNSIGRAVGHQVRITRKGDPRFVALYTVKQANTPADLRNPSRANVVRTGQAGRERLGTTAEVKGVVHATVVDTAPLPGEPIGVRFFEVAEDDGKQTYLIAIAPHGGEIEKQTDEEAAYVREELVSKGYSASAWICKGYGDKHMGASDDLVARIGRYAARIGRCIRAPFLTLGCHRAIQSEPRSPSSHPEAAAQSDELGCL
jgi:hypothetical protein